MNRLRSEERERQKKDLGASHSETHGNSETRAEMEEEGVK